MSSIETSAPMRSLTAFIDDDRGTTVLETLVVFMPVMTLFYANIETMMAYYAVVSSQKAAQLASRVAAAESPIYINPNMPLENVRDTKYANNGPACFQPVGGDACLDPHVVSDGAGGTTRIDFVCDGANVFPPEDAVEAQGFTPDPNCSQARFARLICEVQRFYAGTDGRDVTIRYDYRRLGIAGGPFVPEITVSIEKENLVYADFFSPIGFVTLNNGLGTAVSSSIAEDLTTPPVVDAGIGWCQS